MLISILRTIVPYVWGIIIGALLSVVPILEPLRDDLLAYGDLAVPVIALILSGLWYTLWRWLEPRLPDWLTRVLLGSAQAPIYAKDAIIGEVEDPDWPEGSYDPMSGARWAIPAPHEPTASPDRTE